jgi:chromosome partitioning protein
MMALQGLTEFLKSLSSIQNYRKDVSLKYIVPTFLDKRVGSPVKILDKLLELYEDFVCPPIHYNASFADAPAFGQTTYEFAPGASGTEDYKKLVRRVAGDECLLR